MDSYGLIDAFLPFLTKNGSFLQFGDLANKYKYNLKQNSDAYKDTAQEVIKWQPA